MIWRIKDRQRINSNIGWAAAIIGYYIWFQTFYNAMRYQSVFPYSDVYDMLTGVAYNLPPILLVFLSNLFIVFRLVRINDLKGKICIDLLLSLMASLLCNWLYIVVASTFKVAYIDWAGTILNDIIILMGVEMVYYFTRLSRSRQETEEARLKAVQYQYDALKAQINPHFLFNSLNLLYSLVSIDTVKSRLFIRELSRMYRYIMAQQNCSSVSVAEEFAFLSSYISVLEMRYNNKLSVNIQGEPSSEKRIIPFTMQLLIENVTKHNAITARSPMRVTIIISEEEIIVMNPLFPRETESVSHIGLRYLSQLYATQNRHFNTQKTDTSFTAHVPYL